MKRNLAAVGALSAALAFVGAVAFSQDTGLAAGTTKPVVDGTIGKSEYAYQKDLGQMTLYLSRTADSLYIGVVGNTTGWISAGLGSQRMNGSTIFMGFVADGKTQFKPQAGMGHSHQDEADKAVASTIVANAMKEAGGKTTLEFQLKAGSYIEKGQATLDLIYAMGADDSFSPMHSFRGSLPVTLK